METVLLLLFFIMILIIFSKNELFSNENKCDKIEGECNSKLCPPECKIQHFTKYDKCYCIERK